MCRARIRDEVDTSKIELIQEDELKQIATLYYVKKLSQLDIAYILNYSEETIYSRIKEIKEIIKK